MPSSFPRYFLLLQTLTLSLAVLLIVPMIGLAQERGNPYGEWRFQSADSWGTRYSPVDQIDADNFGDLEVAWVWQANNFGPTVDYQFKSTPDVHRRDSLYGGWSAPHRSSN